jgi:hypothetical protein
MATLIDDENAYGGARTPAERRAYLNGLRARAALARETHSSSVSYRELELGIAAEVCPFAAIALSQRELVAARKRPVADRARAIQRVEAEVTRAQKMLNARMDRSAGDDSTSVLATELREAVAHAHALLAEIALDERRSHALALHHLNASIKSGGCALAHYLVARLAMGGFIGGVTPGNILAHLREADPTTLRGHLPPERHRALTEASARLEAAARTGSPETLEAECAHVICSSGLAA